MRIILIVRDDNGRVGEYTYEGNTIEHRDIMRATKNNPFYSRGVTFLDPGEVRQYIRLDSRESV